MAEVSCPHSPIRLMNTSVLVMFASMERTFLAFCTESLPFLHLLFTHSIRTRYLHTHIALCERGCSRSVIIECYNGGITIILVMLLMHLNNSFPFNSAEHRSHHPCASIHKKFLAATLYTIIAMLLHSSTQRIKLTDFTSLGQLEHQRFLPSKSFEPK